MTMYRRSQQGFSLIEVMVVVGLVALFSMVVISNARRATDESRANQAVTDVLALVGAVQEHSGGYPIYTGINAKALIDAERAAPHLVASPTTLVNQWQGAITVVQGNFGGGVGNVFFIYYLAVPSGACVSIANALRSGFEIEVKPDGGGAAVDIDGDSTAAAVIDACSAGDGVDKTMRFQEA